MSKELSQSEKDVVSGMLLALYVVDAYGQDTLYEEIVIGAGGPEDFFTVAEDDQETDLGHLEKHFPRSGEGEEGDGE